MQASLETANQPHNPAANVEMEDAELQKAIAQSVMGNNGNAGDLLYEPPVQERMRKEDQAVGLRNIGNTCYFNSLLQVYYCLPSFVEKIFAFEGTEAIEGKDELETKKIRSGVKLINELKKMFGTMAVGNRRYVDPRPVLESIVDDSGHQFHIGDERDLCAFNEIFLSRITDAIKATLLKP